jgi:hypothetical protein
MQDIVEFWRILTDLFYRRRLGESLHSTVWDLFAGQMKTRLRGAGQDRVETFFGMTPELTSEIQNARARQIDSVLMLTAKQTYGLIHDTSTEPRSTRLRSRSANTVPSSRAGRLISG